VKEQLFEAIGQYFLTIFGLRHPCLVLKVSGGTLAPAQGTLLCRGATVGLYEN